jgi:hypothetical protein
MDRVWVVVQGILVAAISVLAVFLTGHKGGFSVALTDAVALAIVLGLAAWFAALTDAQGRKKWRRSFRQGLVVSVVGMGAPIAAGVVAWLSPHQEGWLFNSDAAAFVAVCISVVPAAALTSSMVDRFLIIPKVLGLRGKGIWVEPDGLNDASRRRLAQMWVVHRAISELFIFPAIALVLAVVIVAAGNALSSDRTLPEAFESLGGASVAFAVFGFAGPRWTSSLRFILSGPVGLGYWVEGVGEMLETVQGLLVDVSVDPGLKIITKDKKIITVPLSLASRFSHVVPRPAQITVDWCRERVENNIFKSGEPQTEETQTPPTGDAGSAGPTPAVDAGS